MSKTFIDGVPFHRVRQQQAGRPKEKATHLYFIDIERFPFDLRREIVHAFLYIGTEGELDDFRGEAINKLSTAAPLPLVKTAVEFYGICRTIKLYTGHFGEFQPFGESEYNDDKFWRQLFYMLIDEALIIKEIGPTQPGPTQAMKVEDRESEFDLPEEKVEDVMKMFEKMAAGGTPVYFKK